MCLDKVLVRSMEIWTMFANYVSFVYLETAVTKGIDLVKQTISK